MNCILVDDEPLAIDLLDDFISRVPIITTVARCKNSIEAIQALHQHKVDLIFLDIQMPNISGIQLLYSLGKKPMVIFTTAYSEYAIESYNLNAVDYLLKPFDFGRFLKAVNKAYALFTSQTGSSQLTIQAGANTQSSLTGNTTKPEFILVKADYKTIKIKLDDILYIEGLKDYIKIFTGAKPVLTQQTLKQIEERLPGARFIRVHKSFIVAIKHIDSIERSSIRISEARIPIGNSYKEGFQKAMENIDL